MIIKEEEYIEWIINQGVGKKDKVASSIKSYVSYLNSVSRLINEDISNKNLFDENCVELIINKIIENGENLKSIGKYKTAMNQYVKMINGKSNHYSKLVTEKKSYTNKLSAIDLAKLITKKNTKSLSKNTLSKEYKKVFKMPNAVKIMGRSSSITNSFINGIIPLIQPSENEIDEVLKIFNLTKENVKCVYCGDKSTEWDHLRPIIIDKKPTGYISEIQNLVPACGKCNQSKGNKNWKSWINGNAKQSPFTRKIENLNKKIEQLTEFEKWKEPTKIDFKEIIGDEKWNTYKKSYDEIIDAMKRSQLISNQIKEIVMKNRLKKS